MRRGGEQAEEPSDDGVCTRAEGQRAHGDTGAGSQIILPISGHHYAPLIDYKIIQFFAYKKAISSLDHNATKAGVKPENF